MSCLAAATSGMEVSGDEQRNGYEQPMVINEVRGRYDVFFGRGTRNEAPNIF